MRERVYEKAIICYKKSGSPISFLYLGKIAEYQGKVEEAIDYWKKGAEVVGDGQALLLCIMAGEYEKKNIAPPLGKTIGNAVKENCEHAIKILVSAEENNEHLVNTLINLAITLMRDDLGEITPPLGKTLEQYAGECLKRAADVMPRQYSVKRLLAEGKLYVRKNEYEKAAECYKKAVDEGNFYAEGDKKAVDEGNYYLGNLYELGQAEPPIGKTQYEAAYECYKKSADSDAFCNMGILYEEGKISSPPGLNKFQAAEKCYKESQNYIAYYNLITLYKYSYEELDLTREKAQAKLEESIISLYRVLQGENIEARLCGAGLIEQLNENYEAALYWYHQALHLGYEQARDNYTVMQNILSAQHRCNELAALALDSSGLTPKPDAAPMDDDTTATDTVVVDGALAEGVAEAMVTEVADGTTTTDVVMVDETLAEAMVTEDMPIDDPEEDSTTSIGAIPAASFQDFPTYESIQEEMEAAKAALLRAIKDGKTKLTMSATPSSVTRGMATVSGENVENSPRLKFDTILLQREYISALDTTTLRECMEELLESAKPWEKISRGQPEVLRYPFKWHRGCHSLRLNETDRLVYKVKGQNILILNVFGHYDDQNKK